MPTDRHPCRLLPIIVAAAALTGACGTREPTPPASRRPAPAPVTTPSSPWRTVDDSPQLAVPLAAHDAELAAASARARETAPEARRRWSDGPPEERAFWAIKWAASTTGGSVEFVWVVPARWSPFRVEGRLASPPQHELACGRALGDLVSFPVEELADWAHFPGGSLVGPREGGFTMDVLEREYGR